MLILIYCICTGDHMIYGETF